MQSVPQAARPREHRAPAVHPRYGSDFSQLRVVDDAGWMWRLAKSAKLVVKTPIAFKEYLNDPEQTGCCVARWLVPDGDLAKKTSDGYFYFVARKKDIIRRRGENISGAELDRAMSGHPACSRPRPSACPPNLVKTTFSWRWWRSRPWSSASRRSLSGAATHLAPMKVPRACCSLIRCRTRRRIGWPSIA